MEVKSIAVKMKQEGINPGWVDEVAKFAEEYEGMFNLMEMWRDETDATEKREILKDLSDLLKDVKV